jgi:protein tyrosine/serine phosphatase
LTIVGSAPRPSRKRLSRLVTACVVGLAVLVTAAAVDEVRRDVSHRDEKESIDGVANFGRVSDGLYRGAQPTPAGFAHLRALGIGTVVRLSRGEQASAAERALVTNLGMGFIALPWSTRDVPRDEQVTDFLSFVAAHPGEKIFVHCKAGADRTGVFVALYRIAIDHWSAAEAVDEMKAFHYRYLFLPHLERYVEAFPARLTDLHFGFATSLDDDR